MVVSASSSSGAGVLGIHGGVGVPGLRQASIFGIHGRPQALKDAGVLMLWSSPLPLASCALLTSHLLHLCSVGKMRRGCSILLFSWLVKGLREVAKAIEKHVAQICVLAEDCDQPDYVKLIKALCVEHNVHLVTVPSAETLGEWAGLCKIDSEGKARKVVGCSCVVVKGFILTSVQPILDVVLYAHSLLTALHFLEPLQFKRTMDTRFFFIDELTMGFEVNVFQGCICILLQRVSSQLIPQEEKCLNQISPDSKLRILPETVMHCAGDSCCRRWMGRLIQQCIYGLERGSSGSSGTAGGVMFR